MGEASQISASQGTAASQAAFNALRLIVTVGWAIYPIGYMIGTDGWYDGIDALGWNMDVIYNIGDAVNKIGFGLVVYAAAVKSTK